MSLVALLERVLVASTALAVTVGACGCARGLSGEAPMPLSTPGSGGGGAGGGATGGATSVTTSVASNASSAAAGGTAMNGDAGTAGGGGGNAALPLGATCMVAADCASGLCNAVLLNAAVGVCVTPCIHQADCGPDASFFCDPIVAQSFDGYCVPHSPAHCLSCTVDSDCGSLSEICFLAPGDSEQACHVDCTIAGESACPPEYTCTDQIANGLARKLCRPNVPSCVDALGGYCDRLTLPQTCSRDTSAGSCLGQRACIGGSKRFDTCSAADPQCKADCSLQDPAGCTLSYCPGATTQPDNCGMCGNACPGLAQPACNVACTGGGCGFSCQGESYDVDGDAKTGCEVTDSPPGNHMKSSASLAGAVSCDDGNGVTLQLAGLVPSDQRVHETPAVVGFDAVSGSAADWYLIHATGGLCVNDINLEFKVIGSTFPSCYKMTVTTSSTQFVCQTGPTGSCSVIAPSGSYLDNTAIYVQLRKTCNTTHVESVKYTVAGHL